MSDWISRKEWGATRARQVTKFDPAKVKGVAIHHSAGPAPRYHRDCAAHLRGIQRAHRADGYVDIAYNLIVCPHGYTFEGRGYANVGGANGTGTSNRAYVSICVLGKNPVMTTAVLGQLRKRRFGVMKRYGFDARRIRPHSAFTATACPGDRVRNAISTGRLTF